MSSEKAARIDFDIQSSILEHFKNISLSINTIDFSFLLKSTFDVLLKLFSAESAILVLHNRKIGKDTIYRFGQKLELTVSDLIPLGSIYKKRNFPIITSTIHEYNEDFFIISVPFTIEKDIVIEHSSIIRKGNSFKKREKEIFYSAISILLIFIKTKQVIDELGMLSSVATKLAETEEFDDILSMTLSSIQYIFKSEYVHVMTLKKSHENRSELEIIATTDPKIKIGFTFNRSKGISGWIVNNNKFLLVPNLKNVVKEYDAITEDGEKVAITPLSLKSNENDKCVLGVPLRYKGKPIGVILIANTKDQLAYNIAHDQSLLQMFANQVAVIIENIKFKKIYNEWTNKILDAAYLNNPGAIAMSFAHDAKHSLSDINAYISTLLSYLPIHVLPKMEVDTLINTLTKESDKLSALFKSLVKYAKKEKLEVEKHYIKDILDHILFIMSIKLKKIKCEVDPKFEDYENFIIECDRSEIEQLFVNLFNNSIDSITKKMRESGGLIRITLIKFNDKLEIQFKDNGVGIKESDMNSVFDIGFTTKKGGSGFGLAICKRIVEDHHRGNIKLISETNKYTTFFITLNRELK